MPLGAATPAAMVGTDLSRSSIDFAIRWKSFDPGSRVIEVLVEARQLGEVVPRRRLVLERVGARRRGVDPIEQRLLPLRLAGAVDIVEGVLLQEDQIEEQRQRVA